MWKPSLRPIHNRSTHPGPCGDTTNSVPTHLGMTLVRLRLPDVTLGMHGRQLAQSSCRLQKLYVALPICGWCDCKTDMEGPQGATWATFWSFSIEIFLWLLGICHTIHPQLPLTGVTAKNVTVYDDISSVHMIDPERLCQMG